MKMQRILIIVNMMMGSPSELWSEVFSNTFIIVNNELLQIMHVLQENSHKCTAI